MLQHQWLVYHCWLELIFESLGNSFNSSRRLWKFSSFSWNYVLCVHSTYSYCIEDWIGFPKLSPLASLPGTLWFKLPIIATDKALFSSEKCWYLSYFSIKTYVVGTHQKHLGETLLMSTHNIWFRGEIRKMLCGYPLLSVAMVTHVSKKFPVGLKDVQAIEVWLYLH